MVKLSDYILDTFSTISSLEPWTACNKSISIVSSSLLQLSDEYVTIDGNAVHQSATIEKGAILKPPCIIGPNCFIASCAYLRGGVWLGENVTIGPSCEIKSSFIFSNTKVAHFNFIGDSIIGKNVNIEAGAIIANYRNESDDKEITCIIDGNKIKTGINKFGALIGDECRIGANAVLAPGTILEPKTIVDRLTLIDHSL